MASPFLRKLLQPELIRMQLNASSKEDIIRELVGILDETGGLNDRGTAEKVVLEREAIMSTGMENGIAIPHGKSDTVESLVMAIALAPEGVDFDCADGQPANILIITISPTTRSGPHIRFMAEISNLLRNADLRASILAAQTPEEVITLLNEAGA